MSDKRTIRRLGTRSICFTSKPTGLRDIDDRECPEAAGERIALGRPANDRAAGNSRLANHVADEIQVDTVCHGGNFIPLGFKQFQLAGDIYYEIDFSRAVSPKEQTADASRPAFSRPQLGKH